MPILDRAGGGELSVYERVVKIVKIVDQESIPRKLPTFTILKDSTIKLFHTLVSRKTCLFDFDCLKLLGPFFQVASRHFVILV